MEPKKRGPGRPATVGGEKERVKVTFYVHPSMKAEMDQAAQERGQALSEFLRRSVVLNLNQPTLPNV